MVALAVLAIGPMLTNAFDSVDGVDRDAVEAARGHGHDRSADPAAGRAATGGSAALHRHQVAAVTVVATAPIAAIAGGGGLGDIIVNQASYRLSGVLGASLCVMLVCARFHRSTGIQIAVTPRGLRRTSVIGDPIRKELQ